jgi:hypothetical protein
LPLLQRANPILKVALAFVGLLATVLTVVYGVLAARQEITVDPSVSYDQSDPFNQRFQITNNGPLSTYDVHYVCSVTSIQINDTHYSALNSLITVMIPLEYYKSELRWKEKVSGNCDFLAGFGSALESVNMEITVFYKRWLWPYELHVSGWKFSGKRDTTGKFIWDYGSPDVGPFENEKPRKLVFLQVYFVDEVPENGAMIAETTLSNLFRYFAKKKQPILVGLLHSNRHVIEPPVSH